MMRLFYQYEQRLSTHSYLNAVSQPFIIETVRRMFVLCFFGSVKRRPFAVTFSGYKKQKKKRNALDE